MPARNRKGLSENTRKRIQTTMIVKRLQNHILGTVEMTSTQIRAAEILLNRTLPAIKEEHITGKIEHEHEHEHHHDANVGLSSTDALVAEIAQAGAGESPKKPVSH